MRNPAQARPEPGAGRADSRTRTCRRSRWPSVRNFEFGRTALQPDTDDPLAAFIGPWGIGTDGGDMLAADFNRVSRGAEVRHARGVEPDQRRRRLGSPDAHPLRGGADPRPQRQREQRARLGAGPQGRLPTAPERQRQHLHPVPRLGRHVHGALPQHGARGQRHAAALGHRPVRRHGAARRCRRRSRRRRASSGTTLSACRRRAEGRADRHAHRRAALGGASPVFVRCVRFAQKEQTHAMEEPARRHLARRRGSGGGSPRGPRLHASRPPRTRAGARTTSPTSR